MLEGINNYPLTWPIGWPRTSSWKRQASPFGDHSMIQAVKVLQEEIRLLGGRSPVISTNVALRLDGLPKSNQRKPEDPGVAVYFILKGEPKVLACDKWKTVEDNLWAITKHIESVRGQQRWGVGTIDQAFVGYAALPMPKKWWEVLGCSSTASYAEARASYRTLAFIHHPDAGGKTEEWLKIQAAWDEAVKERKWKHET
jgi:hypothetical protein